MPQEYMRKDDNGKRGKSYRLVMLEQNIWRCDCANEGNDVVVDRHENGCHYVAWYYVNDLHLHNDEEDGNEV